MKKLVIKIIISVFIVAIAITGITIYNNHFKNPKADATKNTNNNVNIQNSIENNNSTNSHNSTNNLIVEVNIILYDIDNNIIINDKLEGNNKSLFELLDENYKIRYENSTYGVKLLDMESVTTDFKTKYIAIYVNDKYSNKGVSYIALENGIKIEFKETKL